MADVELSGLQDITVGVGDRIAVHLPQGTTGHLWSLAELGDGIVLEDDQTVAPSTAAPGAQGERVLLLRASAPGAWPVVAQRARPWEGEPVETRRATVTVA